MKCPLYCDVFKSDDSAQFANVVLDNLNHDVTT